MSGNKLTLTAKVQFLPEFLEASKEMEIPVEFYFNEGSSEYKDLGCGVIRSVRIGTDRQLPINMGDSIVIHTNPEWLHKLYMDAERIDVLTRGNQISATYYHSSRPSNRTD
jgi:hypothetical protein